MADLGLVTFFEFNACGLYPTFKEDRGDSETAFGLAKTLEELKDWVIAQDDVENTLPADIPELSTRNKVLCKSVSHDANTGDYLFVFWKCLDDDSGKLSGVYSNASVGDSTNDSVSFATDEHSGRPLLVGHPMYYWFIPELNIFASIKFKKSSCYTDGVSNFIREAIKHRIESPYRNVIFDDEGNKSIVFRDSNNQSLKYLFYPEMMEVKLNNMDLNTIAPRVTHIVVRESISGILRSTRGETLKLWKKTEEKHSGLRRSKQVEVISEARVTPPELRELLTLYASESGLGNDWSNIGFRTSYTSHTTKWFNSYLDRNYVAMDPAMMASRANYPSQAVLDVLMRERDSLLANVRSELSLREESTGT